MKYTLNIKNLGGTNMKQTTKFNKFGGNNMNKVVVINNIKTTNSIKAVSVSKSGNLKPKKVNMPHGTYRADRNSKIYFELKSALNTRHQLDEEKDRRWKMVKSGKAQKAEMSSIDKRIGAQTHIIDGIIAKLAKDKRDKEAVKLALQYLRVERSRVDGIIRSWQRTVSDVEKGRCNLITSTGKIHTDTSSSREYIKTRQRRLARIEQLIGELTK